MEKKGVKNSRLEFEYVPELLQHIQSLLPPEEASRTCILSKSWLYAWSTIPTLRFSKPLNTQHQHQQQLQHEEDDKYINLIDHTLLRYKRENIPLQSLDLLLSIQNQWSLSLLEVWIPLISSKSSCLKELSLTIRVKNIEAATLPEEIFTGESLNMISIKIEDVSRPLSISQHPRSSAANLRVPSLIHPFFGLILFGGRILEPCGQKLVMMSVEVQGLGSNTPSGVPYTEDETMTIIREGKQQGHIPDVGRVLPGQGTVIPPSPSCTDSSMFAYGFTKMR
ncbi:F-box/LRR-repeat protein [Tanacetum coccineum]